MLKIAVGNEKGGIGKTTTTYHLSSIAAYLGDRCVMIDADPQGSLSVQLGIVNSAYQPGLYNILVRGEDFRKHIYTVPPEQYANGDSAGRLSIIPGNAETRLIPQSDQYSRFILDDLLEELEEAGYTAVIFDTGPSPSEWHNAVYMTVDAIVIPAHCEPLGVAGLYNTLAHLQKANKMRNAAGRDPLRVLGVIPNMYRPNTALHPKHKKEIESNLEPHQIPVLDPLDLRVVWGEASLAGKTLYAYAPNDPMTTKMAEMATSLLNKERAYA
jgi:chromosome partitioning protein